MRNIFITRNRDKDNISVYEKEPAVVVTADKTDLSYLKSLSYANNPGIYLLLGENKKYIGQAAGQTINQRLSQHNQNPEKAWFSKIIFFGRIDGNLTRTQADILEAKLIAYFEDNGVPTENKTIGNSGKVDRLSAYQAEELWDTFFEVLEEVANIDLLESSEIALEQDDPNADSTYFITFDHQTIQNKAARRVYTDFIKQLWATEHYRTKLKDYIVDDRATYKFPFGTKPNVRKDGRENSIQIEEGVYFYADLSPKSISYEIEKISGWLGLKVKKNF